MSNQHSNNVLPRIIGSALAKKRLWILPVVALQSACSGVGEVDADRATSGTNDGSDLDVDATEEQERLAREAISAEPPEGTEPTEDSIDGADDEIGTLGQALAPICAVPTVTSGGGITVNNFCGFDVRIRVIWGFAPDSECIHLFVDDSHHFNKPFGGRFDGLDDC